MITRRSLLRSTAGASTLAAGGIAITATPSAAEPADPLLDALLKYRADLAFYNGPATVGFSDDQMQVVEDATWGPWWQGVVAGTIELPPPTTEAGVEAALRCILRENNLDDFEDALLRAVLGYFDGKVAS